MSTRAKRLPDGESVQIPGTVHRDTHEQMKQLARLHHRSVSGEWRQAGESYVQAHAAELERA